jgi:hypothetical protein
MDSLLIPTTRERQFSQTDAELLRTYKKFLYAHQLRESLWCAVCEDEGRPSGLRAMVMDGKIEFVCRCTRRWYRGQSY